MSKNLNGTAVYIPNTPRPENQPAEAKKPTLIIHLKNKLVVFRITYQIRAQVSSHFSASTFLQIILLLEKVAWSSRVHLLYLALVD